jgi:hypothetical protein
VSWSVDHLVIGARTLADGVAWCEATLGVTPGPGGRHPLMGTHNRLLSLASEPFACAYLEIIAIDPEAAPPGRTRWFDLDDAALRASLAGGPRLIHWVARSERLDADLAWLEAQGIDRGEAIAAERSTPQGTLRWRISVRPDGQRLFDGALPTLIRWGDAHPSDTLPDAGVRLRALQVDGLPSALRSQCAAPIRLGPVDAAPRLLATLDTPRGSVALDSPAGRSPARA